MTFSPINISETERPCRVQKHLAYDQLAAKAFIQYITMMVGGRIMK
jgi:hypothetical protein